MRTRQIRMLSVLGGLALAAASQAMAEDHGLRGEPNRRQESWRMESRRQARVQALAHEIDELAGRVAYRVTGARFHRAPYQVRGERQLEALAQAADRFHDQSERSRTDLRRLVPDYRSLMRTFDRANDTFPALRAPGPVRRDFSRLSSRIQELSDLFENRWTGQSNPRYDDRRFDDDRPTDRGGR